MEDIMIDNQCLGEARKAGALSAVDEFHFKKMRDMVAALATRDPPE